MPRAQSLLIALLTTLLASPAAFALTGREIMDRSDKENRADDEVIESIMLIVSASGQQTRRKMVAYTKAEDGDDDLSLIRFVAPARMDGVGMLTIEDGDEDEQWLYLPDLGKSKRIAGASKASSFQDSDLSNYDMRTEDLANHTYELKEEAEVAGRPCYVVEARPKDEEAEEMTGYSRRLFSIDKERWVALQVEYFDRNEKPLKTLVASEYKEVEGLWRAHKVVVENQQEGSKTILLHSGERKINEGLSRREFTKRKLERP